MLAPLLITVVTMAIYWLVRHQERAWKLGFIMNFHQFVNVSQPTGAAFHARF